MDAHKTKELRVRLRRIKLNNNLGSPTSSSSLERTNLSSSGVVPGAAISANTLASLSDEVTKVHFKLAAAFGATATHSSGITFDWQSMKSALMPETNSLLQQKEECAENVAGPIAEKSEEDMEYLDEIETEMMDQEEPPTPAAETTDEGNHLIDSADNGGRDTSSEDIFTNNMSLSSRGDIDEHLLELARLAPFSGERVSVIDDTNPNVALSKILSLPPFDPLTPQLKVQLIIKPIVSLAQLSLRENNEIEVEIKKNLIVEFSQRDKVKKERQLSPFLDVSNILVKHDADEFFTFCSCKNCSEYREIVIHIMVEQFKAAHMVVMLLDVIIKAYGPMLKNVTAYNKFEKLLDANKEIYWIACGFIYNKKAEHMDFIYDESLSDNMILVLFSSILMVNNPLLLLQILSFHIECIVKAYAEGFLEIVEPDNHKIPAEEMLNYILEGYDDLCRISEQISYYLFAFENYFLRKFSLTWKLLCQRLYQQHVYSNLTDTMLACIITLKEDELTSRHAALIKKYIQFDDKMNYIDKRWTDVWAALNKFNIAEEEQKRRKCLLDVYHIFDTVVQDAIAFSLKESDDDNDFYDFQSLENRRLAWQNIMAYTKMKWPDGFFEQPNVFVCEDKCKKCNAMLEYHVENCKCITCSIAGGPLPPRHTADGRCYKCLAHCLAEKEVNFYESKILNVCASDDFLSFVKSNGKRKNTTLEVLGAEVSASLPADDKYADANGEYHVAWTIFHHLNDRKRFRHTSIEEKYFCTDCKSVACQLALKILNNEVDQTLSLSLIQCYQPLPMNREELRSVLPNIMLYNRKMIASNIELYLTDVHDVVVKIYWTFIISLYATYFIEFDQKTPLNLANLDISNNDIGIRPNCFADNNNDTKFSEFLEKIKSLSPFKDEAEANFAFTVDLNTEELQNKLDNLLNIPENQQQNSLQNEKLRPPIKDADETVAAECYTKKTCKEKVKKCCFDHSDLGDHCKENHSNKKRIKKECNHARMNETRDRLRKKLSQLVNARKNIQTTEIDNQHHHHTSSIPPPTTTTTTQPNTKQPPSLKSVASAAAAASISNSSASGGKLETRDDSLQCLSTLCKRITNLHAKTDPNIAPARCYNKKFDLSFMSTTLNKPNSSTTIKQNNIEHIPSNGSSSISTTTNNSNENAVNNNKNAPTRLKSTASNAAATNLISTSIKSSSKERKDLDMVSEIYEFLDNYSKDQSKVKKWINETLSYIEGSSNNGANGKKQPQPTNPKKAAKKAKQKQRREEEKRIAELLDLRSQFHDIYFKEFRDKHNLKCLKSSKKRDKKKISELEANVKNLQRAKGKIEGGILELIATVKQTNLEFKFSYLPTKEQQVEKMRVLESSSNETDAQVENNAAAVASSSINNNIHNPAIIPAGNYTLPYVHANHFPYHPTMDFQAPPSQSASPYGIIHPQLAPPAPPVCYAPPQHQQLSPDVVAAMAANVSCNNTNDPSKRIVTIRRVNLPNVPEPQVTVTAKGSSPDKDKLLYTFVNGQLVQTGTATTAPMTQLPPNLLKSLPLQQPLQVRNSITDHLISLPPPALSKSQMKKERRRLAEQVALEEAKAAAAAAATIAHMEQEHHVHNLAKTETVNVNTNTNSNKKRKNDKKVSDSTKPISQQQYNIDLTLGKSNKKKQQNVNSSTNSNAATKVREDRDSHRISISTTSCSAGTSLTATPTSSQENTRDNSVCSTHPNKAATTSNANKKCKQLDTAKMKSQRQQQQANQKKSNQQQQQLKIPPPQQQQQQQIELKNISTKKNQAALIMPTSCSPELQTKSAETTRTEVKKRRTKPSKFIDSGQFDNNPFKTLHMIESDSEYSSSSSCEDEADEDSNKDLIEETEHVVIKEKPPQQQNRKVSALKSQTEQTLVGNATNSKHVVVDSKQKQKQKKEREKQLQLELEPENTTKTKVENRLMQSSTENTNRKRNAVEKQKQVHSAKQQNQKDTLSNKEDIEKQQQTRNRTDNTHSQSQMYANKRDLLKTSKHIEQNVGNKKHIVNTSSPMPATSGTTQSHYRGNNSNRNLNRNSAELTQSACDGSKPLSKRAQKQALRNKKFQNKQNYDDCCSGIPNHMDYFNPNDVLLTAATSSIHQSNQQCQHQHQHQNQMGAQQYTNLTQQMHNMNITGGSSNNYPEHHHLQHPASMSNFANISNNYQMSSSLAAKQIPSNVSIMDQLNRGVQVENLSLPPGITLTKVDPIKSEQLRQKSESIKKLSKPLQPQSLSASAQAFHQHHHHSGGATITAPPIASVASSYYGTTFGRDQSGIIMVEANTIPPAKTTNKISAIASAAAAASNGKTSKNKKRRNKSKPEIAARTANNSNEYDNIGSNADGQPKMVTLRNPMFHAGPAGAAASIIQQQQQQQSVLMPGRPMSGLSLPTPLPADQPAAIIKNDNGMFTIRNPALHQAVTNGLAFGGYRQFSNVNYYTPQEAAAEAVRATQQQKAAAAAAGGKVVPNSNSDTSTFSYFSSAANEDSQVHSSSSPLCSGGNELENIDGGASKNTHNTISISCTSVDDGGNRGGDLAGDGSFPPHQKCISAIGSEKKCAQQQKQRCQESQWQNFAQDISAENLTCGSTFLGNNETNTGAAGNGGGGGSATTVLQEKYQQSSYYNGFDIFPTKSKNSQMLSITSERSLFNNSDCHLQQHNCDDSPPPSITGFNSYLDGIPSTGIIRYDDASFLKNLIPGQNLNNEVSVHNVNDSNFNRTTTSPIAHGVEISPVYANRPPSTNIYEQCATSGSQQHADHHHENYMLNSVPDFGDNLGNYRNDSNIFSSNNLVNLNEIDSSEQNIKSYNDRFNYDFEAPAEKQKVVIDLNELLVRKSPHSNRTSPYREENTTTMDSFVHNMNTLQISAPTDEQCSQLAGSTSIAAAAGNNINNNGSGCGTASNSAAANGWW